MQLDSERRSTPVVSWKSQANRARGTVTKYGPSLIAALTVACAGGQSGNEGELPASPCPRDQALLRGAILAVDARCVSMRVDETIKSGVPLVNGRGHTLFTGSAARGEVLHARLGSVYAYDHRFSAGESVAAITSAWGDAFELQLLPLEDGEVEARWGSARVELALDELASSTCEQTLNTRFSPRTGAVRGTQRTAPAPSAVECGKEAD